LRARLAGGRGPRVPLHRRPNPCTEIPAVHTPMRDDCPTCIWEQRANKLGQIQMVANTEFAQNFKVLTNAIQKKNLEHA
jgi:hypothetical protein